MNYKLDADRLRTRPSNTWRFYLSDENTPTLDLRDFEITSGMLRGNDRGGQHRIKPIKNILFAFPAEEISNVEPHIEKAQPSKNVTKKRLNKGELRQSLKENIVLTMRGGYVIRGKLQKFDDYRLFMRVSNTDVQVYRHGLFKLKKETVPNQIESNDRNETRKKRHPERIEANRPKKEKVPSQTKTNDLRKLEKNEKVPETTLKKRKFRQGDEHIPSDYKSITAHNEKRLGTDTASRKTQVSMYSDSTHFVYEILQNADDHGATEVCFKLSENEIVIEHNGESFTRENVEAITYFGKSTSRDDLVKTGRFGVGFKSVFAFTATPIIISGNEHFQIYGLYRIKEYPYPNDFSRSRTRIILPFNHESEQPDFVEKLMLRQEAYTQISQCLTTLNMKTLLFTRNIKEIRWEINDRSACYRREDEIDNNVRFTTITNGKHENKYVVFSKVPKWENEAHKAVEIAFAADAQGQLAPIDNDSLYVLFRTEETTDLKFILNGPYRTNPARETISKIDDFNLHLMKLTCELMKESLPYLRDKNLLTVEFLSVLPNQEDTLPDFYIPLRDTIIDEFRNEQLTPTKRGDYEAASRLYRDRSGRGLSDLIQDTDLAALLGQDTALPLWVVNAPQRRNERGQFVESKRISDFLSTLEITEWTTKDLIDSLKSQPNLVTKWLKEKPDIWHQRFYALLDDFISSVRWNYIEGHQYRTILKQLPIVRCSDGSHRSGRECHFLNDDTESDVDLFNDAVDLEEETQLQLQEEDGHQKDFYYVATGIYLSGSNRDEKVRKFLETIGVREVNEAERIKMILKQRYTPGSIRPREADLERFIKLVEADSSQAELFKSYPIFQIDKDLDNKAEWASPQKIFLDSPYLDTCLTVYYQAIKTNSNHFRRPLSSKYAKSGIAPERLGKFAAAVGAQIQLQASEQVIPLDHPEWRTNLSQASGRRQTDTTIDEDYTILDFDVLYNSPSIVKAKLIWRTMCSLPERHLKARFRWNQSNELRTADSSLVHDLRKAKWVPQKDGDLISFVFPREASIERLPEGVPYEAEQEWLQAVEFGKAAREQKAEHMQWNQTAQDLGFPSGDKAKEWGDLFQSLEEMGVSIDDVKSKFRFQNSETNPDFPTAPARNQERRSKLIVEELKNTPEKAEVPARNVPIRQKETDHHTSLRKLYTNEIGEMACQICEKEMPFKKRDGEYYFEAVEILTSHYLPIGHEAQYLALCPECAARYKYFVKEDITMMEVIKKQLMSLNDLKVFVQLGELETSIRFVESHLLDLKAALHYYKNEYDNENSTD